MTKIRCAIFGGSGYGGSELLRILLMHPHAEIILVTANEHAGKSVAEVHRNLLGLTDLHFKPAPTDLGSLDADVVFFALPHGQALTMVPQLSDNVKVIDLSGDFRIDDPAVFKRYYKLEHSGRELQQKFVYGLTEINREAIRGARYVANPGCFATATSLALTPLIASGLVEGKIVVDAKTGSSGSGAKPAANTHHPQRSNSFYAYKPFEHQHVPEIEQHLRSVGSYVDGLVFITHSLPVSRGIFISAYSTLRVAMTTEKLRAVFSDFYKDDLFVREVAGSPDINWVKNTNFCDVSVHSAGRDAVIFAAIDNLVKGAAGQAVQNMNLMFGLPESTALIFTGSNP